MILAASNAIRRASTAASAKHLHFVSEAASDGVDAVCAQIAFADEGFLVGPYPSLGETKPDEIAGTSVVPYSAKVFDALIERAPFKRTIGDTMRYRNGCESAISQWREGRFDQFSPGREI